MVLEWSWSEGWRGRILCHGLDQVARSEVSFDPHSHSK